MRQGGKQGGRPVAIARQFVHDVAGARRLTTSGRSFARYALDLCLYRVMRLLPVLRSDRMRTIALKDGTRLRYRLNRGDIYVIREVWIDESYALPADFRPRVVLDLGAHIGLASLWFARRYRPETIVAVEASSRNAALARQNFEENDIEVRLVEAAVGLRVGTSGFSEVADSHLGHLSDDGTPVDTVTIESLLASELAGRRVDLLKLDIEGAERYLFESLSSWIGLVQAIVGEFHGHDDYTALLEQAGFELASTDGPSGVMCFVRPGASKTG